MLRSGLQKLVPKEKLSTEDLDENAQEWIKYFIKYYSFKDLEMLSDGWIEIDGVKVCGQAQFTSKDNLLSHGTLLIDSKQSLLQKAFKGELVHE